MLCRTGLPNDDSGKTDSRRFFVSNYADHHDLHSFPTRRSSDLTADLAARYRIPVLLVTDVSGQSQSAAALVRGFASHDADVRIAGVVLNRTGSARHLRRVADGMDAVPMPGLADFAVEPMIPVGG